MLSTVRMPAVFSGIVEAQALVFSAVQMSGLLRIRVQRPEAFDDVKAGDSIAGDGVCLTVDAVGIDFLGFALGAETLQVTGWTDDFLIGRSLNLERSVRLGDRVHGHLVTGHVDAIGRVEVSRDDGGSRLLEIRAQAAVAPYVWRKGSWALNGVSLTINDVRDQADGSVIIGHCLIPETLLRTNLSGLEAGASVTIEVDAAARAYLRQLALSPPPVAVTKGGPP